MSGLISGWGRLLPLVALLLGVGSPPARAAEEPRRGEVVESVDLAAEGAEAGRRGVPLLLMVSREGCRFCEVMKEEILRPMTLNRRYDERVLIRELRIDEGREVGDFDGRRVASAAVAARYKARLTPTLLFLDAHGRELTRPMRGINTVEMYGYYLDEALERARGALGGALGGTVGGTVGGDR